jgi:hypothetical protein
MATRTASVRHRSAPLDVNRECCEGGEGRRRRVLAFDRTSNASCNTWHAGAAYLYVLRLDSASLAWEYLRRNLQYQRDWMHGNVGKDAADKWRMTAFEDPFLDARIAHPSWQRELSDTIHLCKAPAPRGSRGQFSLWHIAERKSLQHDGCRLVLSTVMPLGILQISIAGDLGEGDGYAYLVRPGALAQQQWRDITHCDALLQGRAPDFTVAAVSANRVAIAHMRSLQALDGLLAGASHREIAGALFGVLRVKKDWHADGELRAQVRHLIRRGEALMQAGYVDLLMNHPRKRVRAVGHHDGAGR